MPANFDLNNLNGKNGFKLTGANSTFNDAGYSFYYVNNIGDINHDGVSDIAIGAPNESPNNITQAGTTYVVFGKIGSWNASLDLTTLDGNNGFAIYGNAAGELSGFSVAGAGDVNGDGIADLIIGAPGSYGGTSYIIFGGSGIGNGGFLNLLSLDGSNGFIVNNTVPSQELGYSVSGAGDVNADGLGDILIGTPYTVNQYGVTFVIFGKSGSWERLVDPATIVGQKGFAVQGPALTYTGAFVNAAGDVNGDRISDYVISSGVGNTYVIFGAVGLGAPGSLNLNGKNGILIPTLAGLLNGSPTSRIGYVAAAGAGDVNGDGVADFIIGMPFKMAHGADVSGESYVYFGQRGTFILGTLNGTDGFTIPPIGNGVYLNGLNGKSVNFAGDFNGDGIDDFIVGAPGDTAAGSAYLIFGAVGIGNSSIFDLTSLNGNNGLIFSNGIANSQCGWSTSSAGDINGDGVSDIIIGAAAVQNPGTAYVVFGFGAPELVTNQLTINQAETRVLTAANLNATDPRFPSDGLIFTANNVQQGVFSWSNGTKPIFSFAQSAVRLGQILFIQDASNLVPSYAISVTNPVPITTVPKAATISFNAAPIIVNNTLTLKRSQTVMLTESELAATDIDSPAANLTFTISNIVHGQFSKVSQPTVPIVTFIQSQISARQIQFRHDGGINPPSYDVLINDGKMNDLAGPQPVNVHFDVGDLSSGNSNLSELVGGIAGALVAVGLLFFGSRYILDKKNKKSVHDLLKSGASSYEIELQEYNRKIIGSIVNEIFEKIKTTNILSYRGEDATRSYVASIERMIGKLNEHRVNLDFDSMDVSDRSFLIREIVQKTRQFTVSKREGYFGNFFSAEITPNQLDSKVDEIAFAVKESVTKSRPNLILEPGAPLLTSRVSVVKKLSTSNLTEIDDIKIVRVKS